MYQRSTRVLSILLTVSVLFMLMAGIALPSSAEEALPSVYEAASSDSTAFGIGTVEELVFAGNNEALFGSGDTLFLTKSINLIGEDRFTGFEGLSASFDGQGNMIYGWSAASRGLFYNCPMASIKNLTLYKVKLDASSLGGAQWPALVFGMQQTALNTLQSSFVMENVHVKESQLIRYDGADTGAAILMSRYRTSSRVTVDIRNCSIVDTAITGNAAKNNVAAIMGGVSVNVAANSVFNISNIYVDGFSHLNAANHCGVLFGEMRRTMNISNIAVLNSALSAFGNEGGDPCDASIVGRVFEGPITLKNILMAGNSLSSEEGSNFILAMHSIGAAAAVNFSNVYCDTALTPYEGGEKAVTFKDYSAYESGEVAYLASTDTFSWTMKDGLPAIGTAENQVRKITVSGAEEKTLYANSGEQLILPGMVLSADKGEVDESSRILTVPLSDVQLTAYAADSLAGRAISEIAYFNLREAKYYADGLEAALSNVEEKLSAGTISEREVAALEAFKGNYKSDLSVAEYPSVQEWALYPDMKGYLIRTHEDLLAAAELKNLTAEQVVYLGADLDMSDVAFNGFTGVAFSFDGQNHTIRNWTASTRGFFDWYGGKFIKNLKLEDAVIEWTTSDGVGLVVGRRYTKEASDFTMENIHVNGASVTNNGCVVDDGGAILLGTVCRPVNTAETALLTYGEGKTVTLKNCIVTDTAIEGYARQRVAALIGHVWGGFTYHISNAEVVGFTNRADAPAALLLGETEGAKVTFTNIALFNSSGAATAVTAVGEDAEIVASNFLCADSGALGDGVTFTDSFADVEAEGITTLSSIAFKNSEAAWKANENGKVWKVAKAFGYPSMNQEAYPYRIAFKEGETFDYYYTNSKGVMLLDEQQSTALAQSIAEKEYVYSAALTPLEEVTTIFNADTTICLKSDLDGLAAAAVDEKITAIGTVALESKEQIEQTRAAYEALTELQQRYVTKLDALIAAENSYQALLIIKIDEAEAKIAAIDANASIKISTIPAIEAAVEAYEALPEAQRVNVENAALLERFITTLKSYPAGDVNMDAKISIGDVSLILRYVGKHILRNKLNYWVANLNEDDIINTADAIIVIRKVVGKK